jgi:hypothetical protein
LRSAELLACDAIFNCLPEVLDQVRKGDSEQVMLLALRNATTRAAFFKNINLKSLKVELIVYSPRICCQHCNFMLGGFLKEIMGVNTNIHKVRFFYSFDCGVSKIQDIAIRQKIDPCLVPPLFETIPFLNEDTITSFLLAAGSNKEIVETLYNRLLPTDKAKLSLYLLRHLYNSKSHDGLKKFLTTIHLIKNENILEHVTRKTSEDTLSDAFVDISLWLWREIRGKKADDPIFAPIMMKLWQNFCELKIVTEHQRKDLFTFLENVPNITKYLHLQKIKEAKKEYKLIPQEIEILKKQELLE